MNKKAGIIPILVIAGIIIIFLSVLIFFNKNQTNSEKITETTKVLTLTPENIKTGERISNVDYSLQKIVRYCKEIKKNDYCKIKKYAKDSQGCFIYYLTNCTNNETFPFDSGSYYLDMGSKIISGKIKNEIEQVANLNGEYYFQVSNAAYYNTSAICSSNQSECKIQMSKKPSFTITMDSNYLAVIIKDGVIIDTTLCFSWEYPLTYFEIPIERIKKPENLKFDYDKCYFIDKLNESKSYKISKIGNGEISLFVIGNFMNSTNITLKAQI